MELTIFTPLYNRADIVERLYLSLRKQNVKEFEWLVIDDGSKDNAEMKFSEWEKRDNGFEMRYFKTENGGKHRAINKAVKMAKGRMFFIVDSDDWLPENAVEKIFEIDSSIKDKSGFAGFSGIRRTPEGKLIGTTFEGNYVDVNSLERDRYGITGDKSEVFYLDVLKSYPFPEIEHENFITEDIVWSRMAHDGYKIRWTNEEIYLGDYLEGGLTMQGRDIFIRNPIGYTMYVRQIADFKQMDRKERYHYYYYCYDDLKDTLGLFKSAKLLQASAVILGLKAIKMNSKQLLYNIFKKNKVKEK
ncbi:MAG: glycosyltransferase family 2 protein [Clostridia bacterium]|nr:glycosyltransferase family 2 protein [Clostridia bacterium]